VNEVDGIAFTRGPGMGKRFISDGQSGKVGLITVFLGACLSVGYVAARTIATVTNKPFVGVHHMVCVIRILWEA